MAGYSEEMRFRYEAGSNFIEEMLQMLIGSSVQNVSDPLHENTNGSDQDAIHVHSMKIDRIEARNCNAQQIFSRKLQDINEGRLPPNFKEDGVYFYYIHRGSIYFVAISTNDEPPVVVIEFLSRLYHMSKDLCGVVTEESIRVNTILLFEILCEAMDEGYVQIATTENLRPFIQSSPVAVSRPPSTQEEVASRIFGIDSAMAPVSATTRSTGVSSLDQQQLYVDVVENITAVINSEGDVDRLTVEGTVNVKNLLQGHRTIKIALNEDLQICKPGEVKAFGRSVQLDHCTFHQFVELTEFEANRIIKMVPPSGQFSAMAYGLEGSSVSLPLRILITIDNIKNSRDVLVKVRVILSIPAHSKALRVHIILPLPASVSGVSQQVKGPSESLIFQDKEKQVVWLIRNMSGGEESIAHLRLISHSSQAISRKDIGPATADFELSNMTLSGLHIHSVKIYEGNQPCAAKRFVRYVTASNSYTVKTS